MLAFLPPVSDPAMRRVRINSSAKEKKRCSWMLNLLTMSATGVGRVTADSAPRILALLRVTYDGVRMILGKGDRDYR